MNNVIDVLEERGFIDSKTHDHELRDYINSGPATCYIGFDPTAASLHIGSLVPIMALAHMQRNGHRPIFGNHRPRRHYSTADRPKARPSC